MQNTSNKNPNNNQGNPTIQGQNQPNQPYMQYEMNSYNTSSQNLDTSYRDADIITNKINLKNIEFSKIWDDQENENYRPESVTFKSSWKKVGLRFKFAV